MIARAGAIILESALKSGIDPEDIHIAGHSLGGHLMSFLAKDFKKLTNQAIGRFTPLDAAGPLFDKCPTGSRTDKSDAGYVDFIHTDYGKLDRLGLAAAVGHADFYINDGGHQPGCPEFAWNCNHQRAVQLWTSSFYEPCTACPCQSYDDLMNEMCDFCISQNTVGYWSVKKSEEPITYYIRTTDKAPYCKYGP